MACGQSKTGNPHRRPKRPCYPLDVVTSPRKTALTARRPPDALSREPSREEFPQTHDVNGSDLTRDRS